VDNSLANLLFLFYEVSFEQERLNLFESNIKFSEERLRIVEQKYNVGKESKISLLQAQVDLNTDRSSLIQQQELLLDRKIQLLRVMGLDQEPDFFLETEVMLDSTLKIGELLAKAEIQNPLLMSQNLNFEIATQLKEELSRSRLPEVNLNVDYSYSNLESDAGFLVSNQTTGLTYGLTARMNIFNGFNRQRELQNAEIQKLSADVQREDTKSLINSTIRTTYNGYFNNYQLSRLEEENLKVAFENSEIALERFRLGVSDALELREAQVNYVNAQIRYLQAVYDTKMAEIELQRLTGSFSSISE
jgi:outer membrane protein TolC